MVILKTIIANILTALYQPFWYALLLTIFFLFVWKKYDSLKSATMEWLTWFKTESLFRRMFFLVFYAVMILFRTLLNRDMWANPISNVIGVWGLHKVNSKGEILFTTEVLENLALFIPFTILFLWTYGERIIGEEVRLTLILWESTKMVFFFSFTIEMLQLFLRLGTWQLSDLFYNTLGGFIGGGIYWCGYRLKHMN
ncbi:MAG: VanZ family protein [Anaerobutyricum hallii]|uniref:VanZ family protein n=1 Tax=Anaerobutyricum hallii TaxID=39488 RepID=UPI002A821A5E|nr:VanZ family protein [Anaerobutyricum hallii]MDY4576871.1 VanZ family protein [Anaerobutyricum hallii]